MSFECKTRAMGLLSFQTSCVFSPFFCNSRIYRDKSYRNIILQDKWGVFLLFLAILEYTVDSFYPYFTCRAAYHVVVIHDLSVNEFLSVWNQIRTHNFWDLIFMHTFSADMSTNDYSKSSFFGASMQRTTTVHFM